MPVVPADGQTVVRQLSAEPVDQIEANAGATSGSARGQWRANRRSWPVPLAAGVVALSVSAWGVTGLVWARSSLVVALGAVVAGLAAGTARLVTRLARAERLAASRAAELERARLASGAGALTGLAGREQIVADLRRRLADRDPGDLVGVLFCDLDRLWVVNDALGHDAGDEVLSVAARRLSRVVREVDLLGRFRADEFVVVSSGLPAVRDLEILADRLIEALAQPTALAGGSAPVVSASIGIASASRQDDSSADDLLRDAATALHRAKDEGGGRRLVFDRSMRADARTRLSLEQGLRAALRNDELEVHYQPLVDVGRGRVDRLEALVRWNHPDRGTVLPSEFLPIAAQSRLMVEIGERVLVEACGQAVEWSRRLGRPIGVAVNVAERQLMDPGSVETGLVETVTRALASTGLPAEQLELEVSEDLILQRIDRSQVVLRQLDLLGVRLAIDDFGTRQASLSRLKELAMVSTLKIDRLFVADIAEEEVDRRIVAAIVAMAASVGLSVVAEGVETEAQARVLADLGVDDLQGFLFARPRRAGELDDVFDVDFRHRLGWPPEGG